MFGQLDIVTTVTAPTIYDSLIPLSILTDDIAVDVNVNEAFLARAIKTQTKAVQNYCKRPFFIEGLTDTVYLNRWTRTYRQRLPSDDTLQISRWPVQSVTSVTEIADDGTSTVLVANTDYVLNAPLGQLIRLDSSSGFPIRWRQPKVAVVYFAGYGSTPAEAHTVPASGPYTISVTNKLAFAADLGVTYASGTALTLVTSLTAAGQYTVNAGVYAFYSADAGASVIINYAYNQIPLDIQDAVTRMVLSRLQQRDKDRDLMEEDNPNVGRKRWWIPNSIQGNLSPDIREILDSYRVPTIG